MRDLINPTACNTLVRKESQMCKHWFDDECRQAIDIKNEDTLKRLTNCDVQNLNSYNTVRRQTYGNRKQKMSVVSVV